MIRASNTKTGTKSSRIPPSSKRRGDNRPNFDPIFTKDEAIKEANAALRSDHPSAVGLRMTCIILSGTAEDTMQSVKGQRGVDFVETAVNLLDDTKAHLRARLKMIDAAQARLLWSAMHVHKVDMKR